MRNTADLNGGKPIDVIAIHLRSRADNTLVAFYDTMSSSATKKKWHLSLERCHSFYLSRTPHETKHFITKNHHRPLIPLSGVGTTCFLLQFSSISRISMLSPFILMSSFITKNMLYLIDNFI
jgi:hypothetical protein